MERKDIQESQSEPKRGKPSNILTLLKSDFPGRQGVGGNLNDTKAC